MHDVDKYVEDDELVIDLSVLFYDLWRGLKKFWWIFLIICSITASLNYARTYVQYRPMYESKVSFTVSTFMGYDESNTSYGFYYNQSTAEQLANLFPYVLQSDVMRGLIQEELHTGAINGSVSASAVPNSNLFTMKAVSSSPAMAKQILQATLNHLPEVTKYIIGETKLNIIQPVTTPELPYNRPSYRKQIVLGVMIGMGVSVVWLGLYALFRRTIRKEVDFKNVLNLKCLGSIPFVKFKEHKKKEIDCTVSVKNERTKRLFKDSFQGLALKFARKAKKEGTHVFMVTSALPNEGKSTVSMNLAYILAEHGHKVLLMDLDLRSPSLEDLLKVQTECIGDGSKNVKECMKQVDANLWFAGSKRMENQTISELLTKGWLEKNVNVLKKEFDFILMDVPPCGIIADALTISAVCDGTLFVIRQDMAKQGQIIDAMQSVSSHGTPIVGGVLNGIDGYVSHSGYGSYGYKKYGYGYSKSY